jgi:hypothetical protein
VSVLASTEAEVLEQVRSHTAAVGLLSLRTLQGATGVRALEPGGIQASVRNYLRGAYPRACTLQLVYRPKPNDLAPLRRALASNEVKRRLALVLTLP